MIRFENQCVGCPPEMGCMGMSCPNRHVAVLTCDDCGDYAEDLYYGDDGSQYCKYCLHKHVEKVKIEDD